MQDLNLFTPMIFESLASHPIKMVGDDEAKSLFIIRAFWAVGAFVANIFDMKFAVGWCKGNVCASHIHKIARVSFGNSNFMLKMIGKALGDAGGLVGLDGGFWHVMLLINYHR